MTNPQEEKPLLTTTLNGLKLLKRGKVRDIYELNNMLLIVATDRISAFDVVLPTGIPFKGKVLTQMSWFWFSKMEDLIEHHVISIDVNDFPSECEPFKDILRGRSMLVKKATPLPVECVVRGYLSGSGWKEYKKTQSVCGIKLPPGLKESSRLDEPIFSPATKAPEGQHDENIEFDKMCELVGRPLAKKMRDISLSIYKRAMEFAQNRGIIIADTKMEFGLIDNKLILIDELITPDSSRFWPKDKYEPGRAQESFDKQFVRNYLRTIDWDVTSPPSLPKDIVEKTKEKYLQAFRLLTGKDLLL